MYLHRFKHSIQPLWGHWEQHNNANFKGRDYSRRKQFEELEKPVLQQLPKYPYELRQQLVATVMKDGHVNLRLDKHYYSVPYRFIGGKSKACCLQVQGLKYFTAMNVLLYMNAAMPNTGTAPIQNTWLQHHRYLSEWTPEKFMQRGAAIHEAVG